MLAGQAAAVRGGEVRRLLDEPAELPRAPGAVEREVDAHVHAAVAEVAVGHAVEAGVAEQGVEPAQVGPEPVRRDRRVLPPGVRGTVQAPSGEAGPVLPDPPQRSHLRRLGDQAYVDRAGVAGHLSGGGVRLLGGGAGDLGEQPTGAARQVGHAAPPTADHVDDP